MSLFLRIVASVCLITGLGPIPCQRAQAAPLVLFDTGVNGSGNTLGDAATDTHYIVTSSSDLTATGGLDGTIHIASPGVQPTTINDAAVNSPPILGVWVPNNLGAGGERWINTGTPAGNPSVGNTRWFLFEQTFTISHPNGTIIESANISGEAAADNAFYVFLNGNLIFRSPSTNLDPTINPVGGNDAGTLRSFSTNNISFFNGPSVNGGTNTLTFAVWNNLTENGLLVANLAGNVVIAVPELDASRALIPSIALLLLGLIFFERRSTRSSAVQM